VILFSSSKPGNRIEETKETEKKQSNNGRKRGWNILMMKFETEEETEQELRMNVFVMLC
jgi:hypothetical protein